MAIRMHILRAKAASTQALMLGCSRRFKDCYTAVNSGTHAYDKHTPAHTSTQKLTHTHNHINTHTHTPCTQVISLLWCHVHTHTQTHTHTVTYTHTLTHIHTMHSGEQPPVVWVTIGLLAVDGLALQLKLKRADKPRERDKVSVRMCTCEFVYGQN